MRETINKMLIHPIATILIIGSVADGVARIIGAVKGKEIQPVVQVTATRNPETN